LRTSVIENQTAFRTIGEYITCLNDQVTLFFEDARENDFKDISFDSHTTIDPDHGRMKPENILLFLKLIDT